MGTNEMGTEETIGCTWTIGDISVVAAETFEQTVLAACKKSPAEGDWRAFSMINPLSLIGSSPSWSE
jgi:hypothetical protein